MRLPFFNTALRADTPSRPERAERTPVKPRARTRTSGDRIVDDIGWVLAALPSVGPAHKAWSKIGFALSEPDSYRGCASFDLPLGGGGLRFLAPVRQRSRKLESSVLDEIVRERLITGAGLLGWTWSTPDPTASARTIERLANVEFVDDAEREQNTDPMILPPALTPGAHALLDRAPEIADVEHPNHVVAIDHIVLSVSDTLAAAWAFEKNFHLTAKHVEMRAQKYAFLKLGQSVIEIAGPARPEPGPVRGGLWGLGFRSSDLDATVGYLHQVGVRLSTPTEGVQGGRIAALPIPLGGVHVGFVGR